MNHAKLMTASACLLSLTVLSGCHGDRKIETGMPVIDRWITPGPTMQPLPMMSPGQLEYADPPSETRPAPVPEPAPPSALLRPAPRANPILPLLPGNDEGLQETYFEDEAGYTPAPSH